MILKLRYWNLQLGYLVVPYLCLSWAKTFREEHGFFGGICALIVAVSISTLIAESSKVVSSNLNSQMN